MLLDVDHGTYPYVTSSNCVSGSASAGAGIPPQAIGRVIGIAKTYTTRVGGGPFPTELADALGERLRADGDEYGATTGRPRRCGWFDAFATRYAAEINGFSSVALTKLDVLDALEEIKVCVGYELNGKRCESLPSVSHDLRRVVPIYEKLPGWNSSTLGVTQLSDLPREARGYVSFLSDQIGVQIGLISTGPERSQTIIVRESALAEWLR
jgi:adenylosuccinate synthase